MTVDTNTALSIGDVSNLVAMAVGVTAIIVAAIQFRASRKYASAATVISIHQAFRETWQPFSDLAEDDPRRFGRLAEVMNVIELATALSIDKAVYGLSGTLLEDFLCDCLAVINASKPALTLIEEMLHAGSTFEQIAAFCRSHRDRLKLDAVFEELKQAPLKPTS